MSVFLRRLLIALVIGLLGALSFGGLAMARIPFFERFENASYDMRMSLRASLRPGNVEQWDGVVFVDIDDYSLSEMTFPVPRDMYAVVLDALREAGAKAIGFDILFAERATRRLTQADWDDLHYSVYEAFEKGGKPDRLEDEIHAAIDRLRSQDPDFAVCSAASAHGHAYFPTAFTNDPGVPTWRAYRAELERLEKSGVVSRLVALFGKYKDEFASLWFSRTSYSARARVVRRLLARAHDKALSKQVLLPGGDVAPLVLARMAMEIDRRARDLLAYQVASSPAEFARYYNTFPEDRRAVDERLMRELRFNEAELRNAARDIFQNMIFREITAAWEKARRSDPSARLTDVCRSWFRNSLSRRFDNIVFEDDDIFSRPFAPAERMLREYLLFLGGMDRPGLVSDLPFSYDAIPPLLCYLESSPRPTYIQIIPDEDGVVRHWIPLHAYSGRIPQFEGRARVYPLMSFQLVLDYLGVRLEDVRIRPGESITVPVPGGEPYVIPIDDSFRVNLNWVNGDFLESFSHISFLEIYNNYLTWLEQKRNGEISAGDYLADRLRPAVQGKIVLIGLTATGTHDYNPIPLSPRYPMVGAHANFISNFFTRRFIRKVSPDADFLLTFSVLLFLCLVLPLLPYALSFVFFLLVLAGWAAASWFLLLDDVWVNSFYTLAGGVTCGIAMFAAKYIVESRSRARLKKLFSYYLSPKLVDDMADKLTEVKLGGDKLTATVYFSDIAGFTSLSEVLDPTDLVDLLNRYLTRMTDNILECEGMLDKYIGDAIVAAFGVPFELPDHAALACRAAVMNKAALAELNRAFQAEGLPALKQRIGINTGELVAGNMGSTRRLSYTVMGDTVNLGSRLENANKFYGTEILVSESTVRLAGDGFLFRRLDRITVAGKKKPVAVFELVALRADAEPSLVEGCAAFEEGLDLYFARDWDAAARAFRRADELLGGDPPSRVFIRRCSVFAESPPPDDWNGVWEFKEKK